MRHLLFLFAFFATSAFAGERVIINPDQDGDLKIKVNDGGTVKDAVTVTGSTTTTTIGAPGHDSALLRVGNGNTRNESFSVDVSKSGYTGFIRNLGSAVGSSVLFLETNATTSATNILQVTSPGGTALTATADGKTELNVRSDASCGSGNICSGAFTTTVSVEANNASGTTCNPVYFMRVGSIVTASVRCAFHPSGGTSAASFRMTVPVASGNFTQSYKASGTCGVDDLSASDSRAWSIESIVSSQTVIAYTSYPTFTTQRALTCHYTYEVP